MFFPEMIPVLQIIFIALAVAGLTKIFFAVIRQHIAIFSLTLSVNYFQSACYNNKKQQGTDYYNFFRYQIWRFYRFIWF